MDKTQKERDILEDTLTEVHEMILERCTLEAVRERVERGMEDLAAFRKKAAGNDPKPEDKAHVGSPRQ
jgi:hypothetical protein